MSEKSNFVVENAPALAVHSLREAFLVAQSLIEDGVTFAHSHGEIEGKTYFAFAIVDAGPVCKNIFKRREANGPNFDPSPAHLAIARARNAASASDYDLLPVSSPEDHPQYYGGQS